MRGWAPLLAAGAAAPLARRRRPGALYQIAGPFSFNNPLHENLAMLSLRDAIAERAGPGRAGLPSAGPFLSSFAAGTYAGLPAWGRTEGWFNSLMKPEEAPPGAQEFLRGVVWPDDPCMCLFDDPTGTGNYASGFGWGREFKADPADRSNLVARAHHGDLSFFHAMAERDGELPNSTQGQLLQWAAFLVSIAQGRVAASATLAAMPVAAYFTAQGGWSIARLLLGAEHWPYNLPDVSVRHRAAGALMHLIEDSYSDSHVERDYRGGNRTDPLYGSIQQFHAYSSQDHGLHGKADAPCALSSGGCSAGDTLRELVARTYGGAPAVEAGTRALLAIDAGDDGAAAAAVFADVFALAPGALPAGPGKYKKSGWALPWWVFLLMGVGATAVIAAICVCVAHARQGTQKDLPPIAEPVDPLEASGAGLAAPPAAAQPSAGDAPSAAAAAAAPAAAAAADGGVTEPFNNPVGMLEGGKDPPELGDADCRPPDVYSEQDDGPSDVEEGVI